MDMYSIAYWIMTVVANATGVQMKIARKEFASAVSVYAIAGETTILLVSFTEKQLFVTRNEILDPTIDAARVAAAKMGEAYYEARSTAKLFE